jgi:spore coat protein CotH
MQRRKIQVIIISILLVIVLAPLSSGCGSGDSGAIYASDDPPFYPGRVVEVRLVTTEKNWEFMQTEPLAEEYVKADLWYDGELIPDIAVRTKGNSSLMTTANSGSIRYSLKVDINFFNSARNLDGVKKIVFNNGFSDPTFMRETLAYSLYASMGIPTPRTSFVDLWMNDTHLGLYTMVEAIDKTFITNHFTDNTGNLYKPEMPAAYLDWTEEDYDRQLERAGTTATDSQPDALDINLGGGRLSEIMQALESEEEAATSPGFPALGGGIQMPGMQRGDLIEQMGLKTNENTPDHSHLFRFLEVLNNEPDETFPEEIEKVLDVDETLRYLAVSALVVHLDNYIAMGHNYYLYENNGKFVVLPWDLNMAFGTFNYGLSTEQLINYYIDEPSGGPMETRPLIDRLLSHPAYLEKYHGYLEELLEGPFAVEVMEARINELSDLIRPYVQADELKFFSNKQFERGIYLELTVPQDSGVISQQPGNILNITALSEEALQCLREKMPMNRILQIMQNGPDEKDMKILQSCVSEEELASFLELIEDAVEIPGRVIIQGMPAFGTQIGLINFITERHKSGTEQLAGTRASGSGNGSGNGGSFGMGGNFRQQQGNIQPPGGGG